MREKVLVTGGAGYIGSVLVPMLLESNYHVTVIDNFMYGNQAALAVCHSSPNFVLIEDDITKMDCRIYKNYDYIIPLAAIVGAPACNKNKSLAVKTNHAAISEMMKYVRRDTRILFPNTNSGYASNLDEPCTEDSPLDPISIYGQSKVDAENVIKYHNNSVVFRLATVFGVSPRPRLDLLVQDFVWRAIHDGNIDIFEGHFRRNFVSVRDVARAFLYFMNRNYNGVYNLGLDEANTTKLGLAQKVTAICGGTYSEGSGKDPDGRDYYVSNKKILSTGFHFKNSLESGIREVYGFAKSLKNGDKGKFSNV